MNITIWISLLLTAIHLLGLTTALHALAYSRSSQGAIAWCLSLFMFPYLGLPAYFVFGRSHFRGYREKIAAMIAAHHSAHTRYLSHLREHRVRLGDTHEPLERIANSQFLGGNKVTLLVDGRVTFEALFEAIDAAQRFVLVEFFIIKDDELGRILRDKLIAKAKQGCAVYVLYDEVGSNKLKGAYTRLLSQAGVRVSRFNTRQGIRNFFQFNFRNHRKIVVVDGMQAFIGGHNVGDEYVGRSPKFSGWRDTHIKLEGPGVLPLQAIFSADWTWATGYPPEVDLIEPVASGESNILVLSSGPADPHDRCTLLFLEAITRAKKRVWIASPYFVPDESLVKALQLAAMRGVDVRIMLPEKADHLLVWLASFSYVPEVTAVGVRVFRYTAGFLHQKVFVVDEDVSAVGTANLDNRSLRLNFEVTAVIADPKFAREMIAMLEDDFARCKDESSLKFSDLPLAKRIGSKAARLFSPVL
jgi:cardiolipin synthase